MIYCRERCAGDMSVLFVPIYGGEFGLVDQIYNQFSTVKMSAQCVNFLYPGYASLHARRLLTGLEQRHVANLCRNDFVA